MTRGKSTKRLKFSITFKSLELLMNSSNDSKLKLPKTKTDFPILVEGDKETRLDLTSGIKIYTEHEKIFIDLFHFKQELINDNTIDNINRDESFDFDIRKDFMFCEYEPKYDPDSSIVLVIYTNVKE